MKLTEHYHNPPRLVFHTDKKVTTIILKMCKCPPRQGSYILGANTPKSPLLKLGFSDAHQGPVAHPGEKVKIIPNLLYFN